MNELTWRDRLVTGRTAALSLALRRGDALGAARAAARLRLPAVPLTREQLVNARRARTAVGRSLIHARYFPTTQRDVIAQPVGARPLRRSRRLLRWLVAVPLAGLLVVPLLPLMLPAGPDGRSGAAARSPPVPVH